MDNIYLLSGSSFKNLVYLCQLTGAWCEHFSQVAPFVAFFDLCPQPMVLVSPTGVLRVENLVSTMRMLPIVLYAHVVFTA